MTLFFAQVSLDEKLCHLLFICAERSIFVLSSADQNENPILCVKWFWSLMESEGQKKIQYLDLCAVIQLKQYHDPLVQL